MASGVWTPDRIALVREALHVTAWTFVALSCAAGLALLLHAIITRR